MTMKFRETPRERDLFAEEYIATRLRFKAIDKQKEAARAQMWDDEHAWWVVACSAQEAVRALRAARGAPVGDAGSPIFRKDREISRDHMGVLVPRGPITN